MPMAVHEGAVELFRLHPELALELACGQANPDPGSIVEVSGELGAVQPVELRADLVLAIGTPRPTAGLIVEVQTAPDPAKRYTWPAYVASLRLRLRAPVDLLVVALRRNTASWARIPTEFGRNNRFSPLVVGPDDIGAVDRITTNIQLSRAVLATVLRSPDDPTAVDAAAAAVAAARVADLHTATYLDIIFASLTPDAKTTRGKAHGHLPVQTDQRLGQRAFWPRSRARS